MPKVYRKIILGHVTNMFTCENCLNENNELRVDWVSRYVEDVVPGPGNPGVYEEAPLETCDRCFAKDEQAHEEMHQWSAELDQQSWEEDDWHAEQDALMEHNGGRS